MVAGAQPHHTVVVGSRGGAVIAALLLVAACAPCASLGELEVHGGTASQRGIVQGALHELSDHVGPPVCLSGVQFFSRDDRAGDYNRSTRRIRLHEALDDEGLALALNHEVCHGIDFQNDIVNDAGGTFDRYLWEVPDHSAGHPRHEAFALACEAGPDALCALGMPCPKDDWTVDQALYVQEEVFVDCPTLDIEVLVSTEWQLDVDIDYQPRVVGDDLVVSADGGWRLSSDGDLVSSTLSAPASTPTPDCPPPPSAFMVAARPPACATTADAAALMVVDWVRYEGAQRLLLQFEHTWYPVPLCTEGDDVTVHFWRGDLGVLRRHGATLSWAPVTWRE